MNRSFDSTRAYLLRLRRADNSGQPLWFFSLESTDGRTRHEFRGLPALMEFLVFYTDSLDAAHSRSTTDNEQRRKPT
ncbi:MAG: hypothetical protein WAU10_27210 [Caldilineaceae bacterium]